MYHVILANPPYLSKNRIQRLEPSVLLYEPEKALFAPNDGFMYIRETIDGLTEHLSTHGFSIIEHEPEHVQTLHDHAKIRGFSSITENDQFGVPRFSILRPMA
jgi:methylase of polypeptide subunit release factors